MAYQVNMPTSSRCNSALFTHWQRVRIAKECGSQPEGPIRFSALNT